MFITYNPDLRCFHLDNGHVSYIIRLAAGRYPLHLYWGRSVRRIGDDLLSRLCPYGDDNFSLHETPLDLLPQECPTFGGGDLREGMLHALHADGTSALDLRYVSHEILCGKRPLAGLPNLYAPAGAGRSGHLDRPRRIQRANQPVHGAAFAERDGGKRRGVRLRAVLQRQL